MLNDVDSDVSRPPDGEAVPGLRRTGSEVRVMQVLSADEMASAPSVQSLVDPGEGLGDEQTTSCPVGDSVNEVGVARARVAPRSTLTSSRRLGHRR